MDPLAALHHRLRAGPELGHGGQPVDEPAGEQHHQQQQLEQLYAEHDVQRAGAWQHTASERDCSVVHGRGPGLLFDRHQRLGVFELDRDRWGHLSTRRAVRALEARQDAQRVRTEGSRSRCSVPGRTGVSRYGYGGDAVSIPRGNRQAGHAVVAAEPRVEARL